MCVCVCVCVCVYTPASSRRGRLSSRGGRRASETQDLPHGTGAVGWEYGESGLGPRALGPEVPWLYFFPSQTTDRCPPAAFLGKGQMVWVGGAGDKQEQVLLSVHVYVLLGTCNVLSVCVSIAVCTWVCVHTLSLNLCLLCRTAPPKKARSERNPRLTISSQSQPLLTVNNTAGQGGPLTLIWVIL